MPVAPSCTNDPTMTSYVLIRRGEATYLGRESSLDQNTGTKSKTYNLFYFCIFNIAINEVKSNLAIITIFEQYLFNFVE